MTARKPSQSPLPAGDRGPTLAWMLLACALTSSALARQGAPPASLAGLGQDLAKVPVLEVPAIDPAALRVKDDRDRGPGPVPLGFAEPFSVTVTPARSGLWERLPDGRSLWRLRVHAPQATDLNFGFTSYRLPPGATLHVWSEEGYFEGPYTYHDNKKHGQLWTPVVPGDRAVIELLLPPAPKEAPVLVLGKVNRGFRDLFKREAQPKSGSCNIDVVCPQGDPWRNEIRSEATFGLNGSKFCSGQMINNVAQDCRPIFLTANHCGMDATNAPTMTVYWNYQTTTCAGARDGSLADNQTGATFLASNDGPDFCLLQLDSVPDPAYLVYWSGFDARTSTMPAASTVIHHPNTDEKAISFDNDPLTITGSCIGASTADSHWHVGQYEAGTTEPGSSGSGLWDQATHMVVGQLSGGAASCTVIDYDCYGRLAVSWDLGTTSDTRARDHLDPANTGTRFVAGRECGPAVAARYRGHRGIDVCAIDPTNVNGIWEPAEDVQIEVDLESAGGNMTNVVGTLTSPTPGVTIVDGMATWPTLVAGVTTTSTAPSFLVSLAPTITCYDTADFVLSVSADQGGPFQFTFSHLIGASVVGGPDAITDNTTTVSSIVVGQNLTLTDLDVHVNLSHTWVGDLILTLRSPIGTQVTLLDRPGFPAAANGCGDDDMEVTFDDASAVVLEDLCAGNTPWYAGTAKPVGLLSALNGESTAGTWSLSVSDNAGADEGLINDWTILTTPAVTGTCRGCGVCLGTPIAVNALYAVKVPGGDVRVTLPAGPTSGCATGIQVRLAPTGRPAAGMGSFPTDPPFADVTAQDTDPGRDFRHTPPAGTSYYKVVEDLAGAPGPSGSYGF